MAATIEIKYFNTFWLKKVEDLTSALVAPVFNPLASSTTTSDQYATVASTTLELGTANASVIVGMKITGSGVAANTYIIAVVDAGEKFTLNQVATLGASDTYTYTNVFPDLKTTNLPKEYTVNGVLKPVTYTNTTPDWYIEESRIRGGYNNTSVDLGVKAYLVEDFPQSQHRFNSLIYSGIYNSRTGINNTNQFPVGESITKSADPAYVSIQKLYAEDTNLIIFQEDKVSRALIDKDAIYSAEGSASITSSRLVIGQIIPYKGEYGISTDPYSFSIYGYRKYFTDRKRNCVVRLSLDGVTEISSYGMHDFFRDKLSAVTTNKVVAAFNEHTKDYTLSIQNSNDTFNTLAFDEQVRGWVSLYSYQPTFINSLGADFYSFYKGRVFKHYIDQAGSPNNYGKFYNYVYNSDVTVIFNSQPSLVKTFQTVNYEGSTGWAVINLPGGASEDGIKTSSGDLGFRINAASPAITSLAGLTADFISNNFKEREGKFFANIVNNTAPQSGAVLYYGDTTGVKGYYANVKLAISNGSYPTTKSELFAVSTNYVESSY